MRGRRRRGSARAAPTAWAGRRTAPGSSARRATAAGRRRRSRSLARPDEYRAVVVGHDRAVAADAVGEDPRGPAIGEIDQRQARARARRRRRRSDPVRRRLGARAARAAVRQPAAERRDPGRRSRLGRRRRRRSARGRRRRGGGSGAVAGITPTGNYTEQANQQRGGSHSHESVVHKICMAQRMGPFSTAHPWLKTIPNWHVHNASENFSGFMVSPYYARHEIHCRNHLARAFPPGRGRPLGQRDRGRLRPQVRPRVRAR